MKHNERRSLNNTAEAKRQTTANRREKGDDHEETLAHLAALAAHFEQLGQPEAARPFAEEHARLTAQLAARKKAE